VFDYKEIARCLWVVSLKVVSAAAGPLKIRPGVRSSVRCYYVCDGVLWSYAALAARLLM
jgi:hypothetical protein